MIGATISVRVAAHKSKIAALSNDFLLIDLGKTLKIEDGFMQAPPCPYGKSRNRIWNISMSNDWPWNVHTCTLKLLQSCNSHAGAPTQWAFSCSSINLDTASA